MKPRHRATLHLLALHAPRAVHRELLVERLWPDVAPDSGLRSLHVAVSSLRRLFETDDLRPKVSMIVREGDTYRLALPEGSTSDVRVFEAALASARSLAIADPEAAIVAAFGALGTYTGDLLPEDGPAEWVVAEREWFRAEAADAAQLLADLYMARDDVVVAAQACEAGLRIDRFRDSLWRTLIAAYDADGDQAVGARARSAYDAVLDELGVIVRNPGPAGSERSKRRYGVFRAPSGR